MDDRGWGGVVALICWRVSRIVTGKEAVVNRAYLRRGLETYLPMEVRSHRPSKHTKRRVCMEVPLIPRVLFVALPSEAPSLSKHRYVTGLQRDVFGELVQIPAVQMARFMEAHQEWLAVTRRRHQEGKPGGRRTKRKAKWRTASADVLKEIAAELFGVDLTEPEVGYKSRVRYA